MMIKSRVPFFAQLDSRTLYLQNICFHLYKLNRFKFGVNGQLTSLGFTKDFLSFVLHATLYNIVAL